MLIPKISTAFKTSYADQLEDVRIEVKNAAELYIYSDNGNDVYKQLMNAEKVKIYLNTLSNYGYIDSKIYNPIADDYFNIDDEYIELSMNEIGLISYEFSF